MGFNTCPDCLTETGDKYLTAHDNPFDCIKALRRKLETLDERVRSLEGKTKYNPPDYGGHTSSSIPKGNPYAPKGFPGLGNGK